MIGWGVAGLAAALPAGLPGGLSAVLRAADDPDVTPGPGGTGGFLGFVFTFVLALALIVLVLSLGRQLRKVNRNARAAGLDDDASEAAGATGPDGAEPGASTRTSEQGDDEDRGPAGAEGPDRADDEAPDRARDEGSGGATA